MWWTRGCMASAGSQQLYAITCQIAHIGCCYHDNFNVMQGVSTHAVIAPASLHWMVDTATVKMCNVKLHDILATFFLLTLLGKFRLAVKMNLKHNLHIPVHCSALALPMMSGLAAVQPPAVCKFACLPAF